MKNISLSVRTKSPVKPKPAPKPTPKQVGLTGLSLRQLMNATPKLMQANSEDIVIKRLTQATTKGGFPGIRAKTANLYKRPAPVYDTSFVGKEAGKPISKQKHVLASCSCENFCYYWEYALSHWGSAVIKYSNGEFPEVTNPGLHPGLCKHLYKLAQTIRAEGL